jgi:hypothetical protein
LGAAVVQCELQMIGRMDRGPITCHCVIVSALQAATARGGHISMRVNS